VAARETAKTARGKLARAKFNVTFAVTAATGFLNGEQRFFNVESFSSTGQQQI